MHEKKKVGLHTAVELAIRTAPHQLVVCFQFQLAGGLLTGKHRYEDKDSGKIQHGRYAGTGTSTHM